MKALRSALAMMVWASAVTHAFGQSAELPKVFDFFSIATPDAKSPRIDNYDETWFITGPVSDLANKATEGPNWLKVEGKVIYAYWRFAVGDSALQIARGFEKAAKEAGYEIKFSCVTADNNCFDPPTGDGLSIGILLDKPRDMPGLDELGMDHVRNEFRSSARLMYLTKGEGENMTHMQVAFSDRPQLGVKVFTKTVITGEEPELSGASAMRDQLVAGGSVQLDNLLFDTASAILLPASRDQLHEIAMMLRDDPNLKLQIIGHTDSDGGADYNKDLSERRAAAVVDALVNGFDIEAGRLASSGKGLSEPVASNETSEGKAKNRRVELKLQ